LFLFYYLITSCVALLSWWWNKDACIVNTTSPVMRTWVGLHISRLLTRSCTEQSEAFTRPTKTPTATTARTSTPGTGNSSTLVRWRQTTTDTCSETDIDLMSRTPDRRFSRATWVITVRFQYSLLKETFPRNQLRWRDKPAAFDCLISK